MRQYGFAWPERMNCEGLPEYGDPNNLCMGWESNNVTNDAATTSPSPASPAGGEKNKNENKNNQSPKGNMWSAIPVALLCMLVIVGDGYHVLLNTGISAQLILCG